VPSQANIADQQALALSELAQLGMELARDVAARAKAAATPREAEGLVLAFERIARSVRLTFALQNRLARDARGDRVDAARSARNRWRP